MLWESDCGRVRLYLADCNEVMPALSDVGVIITDPPYGDVNTHRKHVSTVRFHTGNSKFVPGTDGFAAENLGFDGITLGQMVRLSETFVAMAKRWVVMTCDWKYAHALPDLIRLGVWRKRDGAPQFTGDRPGTGWEAVAILHRPGKKRWNGGGRHAFWDVPRGAKPEHPTQKPLDLIEAFVADFSDREELILDPFMGSGTTGVAAVRFGRRFVGIEKNQEHFETAKRRISEELHAMKSSLFDPVPYRIEQRQLFSEGAE